MEPKALFGALTVYRERGAYLRRLEQLQKSKDAYDEAFNNNPTDVHNLTGRSQVCSLAVQPLQAYADAEAALQIEPRNMIARNMQSRALYTMSDFEKSVVMNFRGSRHRTQPPYFMEGINQGLETIQDCVGVNAGNIMMDFLPIIKQEERARKFQDSQPPKTRHQCRIPKPESKRKLTQLEARQAMILSRVLAMNYLGPMAYDKFFLQALTEDICITSANQAGSAELKKTIKEALEMLSYRQENLHAQRPYYTIKLAQRTESKYQSKFNAQLLINEKETGARMAERYLKDIDACLKRHNLKQVMNKAERLQTFLDNRTPRTLPDKDTYTDRLYRAVGTAYLQQHRLSYTLSESGNRRRVAFLMGLPVGRAQTYDSVMANYPYNLGDVKLATEKVMYTLELCENAYMKCWLQYELAKLLSEQKNFALAKFYGKRCQRDAKELASHTWWLNGCFVLMSGDMQQNNYNEVRIEVEEAFEVSKQMQDNERTQAFLAKCAEMAQSPIISDERKDVLKRQRQIISVMDPKIGVEAEVLFKQMSYVPYRRRFKVLPTKRVPGDMVPVRKRLRQRGLTIMSGYPRALRAPPKSATKGFQLFDL